MAIKKSKNNESITDFDNMMNEVEEELEVQQAEQNIADRVPELKQLSTDIDKATTAVINARLSLESSIRQTQREEGVLGAAVNTISGKVDTINKHIDHVMEDAPTKLKVTVNVSDDDWEKMQGHHTQWLGPTTYGDCEEQRRCLAISKTILHRRLPLPPVNHYDCVGDCLLCVFSLDSIRPVATGRTGRTHHRNNVWEM